MNTSHHEQQLESLLIEADKLRFQRRFTEALEIMQRILDLDDSYFKVYYKLALYYYQKGDDRKIFRCLKLSLQRTDDLYWHYVLCGYLQELSKNWEEAKICYSKAVLVGTAWNNRHARSRKSCFDAYFNLACVCMDKAEYDESIRYFHEAMEDLNSHGGTSVYPHLFALCFNNIGCCYVDTDNDPQAKIYFLKAIDHYSGYILALQNVIRVLKREPNLDEIPPLAETILQISTDEDTNLSALHEIHDAKFDDVEIYGEDDEIESAIRSMEEIQRRYPRNYYSYISIASLGYALGDPSRGLTELRTGLKQIGLDDQWGTEVLVTSLLRWLKDAERSDEVEKDLARLTPLVKSIEKGNYLNRVD